MRASERGSDASSMDAVRPKTAEACSKQEDAADHNAEEGPELDPRLKSFLEEMKERFNPAAVAERLMASREREAQGYEALLTYEMIVENPISDNDPALDRMLAARSRIGHDACNRSPTRRPGRAFAEGKQTRNVHAPLRPTAAVKSGTKVLSRGSSATRGEKLLPMLPES